MAFVEKELAWRAAPRTEELVVPEAARSLDDVGDERMPGLTSLMRVLREPETLFGESSERKPEPCRRFQDWGDAPVRMQWCLAYWDARCADVLLHMKLGADVLRDHGVKICRGDVNVTFLEHEDLSPSVFIELSIDATSEEAARLTRVLDRRAIALEVPCDGFTFCFMDGEGGDDEDPPPACVSLRDAPSEETSE
ncbi:hypothetical protein [Mitsuaria sp. GD03876]|uniref:hypothetical protein n=1 Tax=Mitsuaria sp. GD03876 TaxID=2975399 RepID=UPI00244CD748|nr:hypothetical protein [Mitsuaria sp. GD03876]MDH0866790.1 hypothetical protein [Mitsuaria sp. GD03876]